MCEQVLDNYITQLNSATLDQTVPVPAEPFPIILKFDGICDSFQTFANELVTASISGGVIGYSIPSNKTLTIYEGPSGTGRFLIIQGPFYNPNISEFEIFWSNDGSQVTSIGSYKTQDKDSISWTDRKPFLCTGEELIMGFSSVVSFQEGGNNCDVYMTRYCNSGDNVQKCSPLGSTEQYKGDPKCSCFHEQTCLQEEFDTQQVEVPVSCFGSQCSNGVGYQTSQMKQETCNAQVCSQFVELNGDDIYLSGTLSITCGNVVYTLTPTPPPPTPVFSSSGLPDWATATIAFTTVIVIVILMWVIGKYAAHWW